MALPTGCRCDPDRTLDLYRRPDHPPLEGVLPESVGYAGGEAKHTLELMSGGIAIAGILLAAALYLGDRQLVTAIANSGRGVLSCWWYAAWGFDWLYDKLFVQPFMLLVRINRRDGADLAIGLIPKVIRAGMI